MGTTQESGDRTGNGPRARRSKLPTVLACRRVHGAPWLLVLAATSCVSGGEGSHSNGANYGGAAVAAATAVALAGVHRATTGGCWGQCSAGLMCHGKSGLCVVAECTPGCRPGQQCQELSVGLTCVAVGTGIGLTGSLPGARNPTSARGLGGAPAGAIR